MRGFRAKGHERAGLRDHMKTGSTNTREDERPATMNTWSGCLAFSTQKYNCRNQSTFCIELQQPGIPVLMCNEEVAFTITQKLRILTFIETHTEMFFDSTLAGQQSSHHQLDSLARRNNAKRVANIYVN